MRAKTWPRLWREGLHGIQTIFRAMPPIISLYCVCQSSVAKIILWVHLKDAKTSARSASCVKEIIRTDI